MYLSDSKNSVSFSQQAFQHRTKSRGCRFRHARRHRSWETNRQTSVKLETPALVRPPPPAVTPGRMAAASAPPAVRHSSVSSVPKRRAERERLLTSLSPQPRREDRISFFEHRRRRRHEGDRASAGRTVRQPDRLQGEIAAGENGAEFCHMCANDRFSKSDIAWQSRDRRTTSRVWAVGGGE